MTPRLGFAVPCEPPPPRVPGHLFLADRSGCDMSATWDHDTGSGDGRVLARSSCPYNDEETSAALPRYCHNTSV